MVFEFLSNFCLTNDIREFERCDPSTTKVDLRKKNDHLGIVSNAFLKVERIIIYYDSIDKIKNFLKMFLMECAGGKQYIAELDDIININLGLYHLI